MKKSGALWLIAIGGIFLAYQLGYVTFSIGDLIRTFWPSILIMIGLSQLLGMKKHSSSAIGNVIMVVIGGYFQARNLGIDVISPGEFFKFLFPAALIFGGIYALVKPKRSPVYPPAQKESPEDMYNKNYPPTPPVPPAPIEPLESPLDRMFVNLDKDQTEADRKQAREEERSRYEWKPEDPERESGGRDGKPSSSEFQKIGDMARDIGKQTADQVRKIDFSRIADEVKSEVDSAMKDLKKSMKSDHEKHVHGKSKISLEKDPFPEDFADGGRFYDGCGEDSNYRFGGYDREAMKKARQQADKEKKEKMVNESSFIGDYYIGRDYFRLKPMNVSHFIGDTVIDLTKAQIPYGTTKINVSSFIGDVVIYMPNDPEVGVKVHSSSFLGDQNILGNRRTGMVGGVDETYNYDECAKRIKINVSSFISDVNVNIVG